MSKIKIVGLCIACLLAAGCATKMSDVTDEDSSTMKEIYEQNFDQTENNTLRKTEGSNKKVRSSEVAKRKIYDDATDLNGYTRTANNEHEVLFKRINNPVLVGYVFAHLTSDSIPIPGYSIPFRMSEKDYYAMPGEDQKF